MNPGIKSLPFITALLLIVQCSLNMVHAAAGDLLLSFPPPERLIGHLRVPGYAALCIQCRNENCQIAHENLPGLS
ncbi:MAG: hypothetical protein GY862_23060 [Gammaproteobacteria bacterium]|nr:hypothetical protein [Gammaproteobacteria bacterium]